MPADVETITRTEFERYRSLVQRSEAQKDAFYVAGMAVILAPIVTTVATILERNPQHQAFNFLVGSALSLLAGYTVFREYRKYQSLRKERETLGAQYR